MSANSLQNQLKHNQSLLHENKGLYSQLKLGIFEHKEEKVVHVVLLNCCYYLALI